VSQPPDLKAIRLLVLDVDGVMTDGSIIIDDLGHETKRFHVRDGSGIRMWQKMGGEVAIITGRASQVVAHRAAELKVNHVMQAVHDKGAALQSILDHTGLNSTQAAAIGDDVVDLPLLRGVGYPIAVADAVAEIREVARFVTKRPGGRGAVREAIEHLLVAQGRWDEAVSRYVPSEHKEV